MDQQVLLATLNNHWGKTQIIRPLTGGNRNQAWLIKIEDQFRVAKTTRRSESALEWLSPVHDAAESAGFLVPRLLPSLQGLLSVDGLTVERFIDGSTPSPTSLQALEPLLAQFHRNSHDYPQRPTFASSIELLGQEAGGDVDLGKMPAELARACRDAWQIFANAPKSVVHGDLNASNILVTSSGQPALLDWDESRVDASIFDQLALAQQDSQPQHNHTQHSHTESEKRALLAWEIAVCWCTEHDYAQGLVGEFTGRHS